MPLSTATKIAPRRGSSSTWNDFDHLGGKGAPGGANWIQRRCEDGLAKEEHAWLNLNEESSIKMHEAMNKKNKDGTRRTFWKFLN